MSDLPTARMAVSSGISSLGQNQWESLKQRGSKLFFDGFRTVFGLAGLDTAAKNLRRYRSAVGGTQVYSDREIDEHLPVTEAEDTNRTLFSSRTLIGKTDNKDINDRLLNMADGGEEKIVDLWKTSRKFQGIDDKIRYPNTFAAFGPFDVRSTSDLVARRKGNKLYFTGKIRYGFDEENDQEVKDRRALGDFKPKEENIYNFNEGAIGSGAAKNLEPIGAAKPFRMQYERLQELNAEAEYMPGGGLVLRSAKWGAIR